MAVSSMVAAVAVSAASAVAQKNAADDQKEAAKEQSAQQQASNQAEAARSRRENLRRQRIAQAEVEAAGEAQGTAGSSANLAVADNISSTAASGMSSTGQRITAINNAAATQQASFDAQARQQTFQAIGGLASTGFNMAAGTKAGQAAMNNLFS